MISDADNVILEFLRKGLAGHLPADAVYFGEYDPGKAKSLSVVCTSFEVEEEGIGGSGGILRESMTDEFTGDGRTGEFTLSKKAVYPLLAVETPPGKVKNTPDDYTTDYERNLVTLRVVPEKKARIRITYHSDSPVAETRTIRLLLTYHMTVGAGTQKESDQLVLETMKALYREHASLEKAGVSEVKLVRGFVEKFPEAKGRIVNVLEYSAQTVVRIEIPLPPIAQVIIGNR